MMRLAQATRASAHTVGMLAFLALFPGFFFYHTALGLGKIDAFLGGYFAVVSLLAAPVLWFFYAYQVRHDKNYVSKADAIFVLYLAFFAATVLVNAVAGANGTIVANHLLALLFMLNLFLIFRMTDFGTRQMRIACVASLLAMSAIAFSYSVDGAFYLAPLGVSKHPESLATYQGFSRSYLVTFAVVIAFTKAIPQRLFLYCLAAPTLFLNTARSEFVAMLFMMPIIEIYYARHKLLATAILAGIVAMVYLSLDQLIGLLPSNRILELLDLSQSTSASKRHHLTLYALNSISQFPIFGDYASYAPGFYSHNVLSAWVDTGIFGFLFILGILIVPAGLMFVRGYFTSSKSSEFILGFTLSCVTLLLLITSHYFTDMLIGASLAAYSTYGYRRKHALNRPSDLRSCAPRHAHFHQAVPGAGRARV